MYFKAVGKKMRFRCYSSSDQSFSTSSDTTNFSQRVGSTTLNDKVIVTLSNLKQYEVDMNASRAKRAVKTHDPLALVANTYARNPRTTANSGNGLKVQCYNYNAKGHYARDCLMPKVCDSKNFQEQMFLSKKDETGFILDDRHNDFLHVDVSEVEEFKDLNATVHDGKVKQDNNAHDQRHTEIESLIKNVQIEAEKQRTISKEVKQRNVLLTKELEKYKERIREFEIKTVNRNDFQKAYIEATHREKKLDQQMRTQFFTIKKKSRVLKMKKKSYN
nr:hypothetical protein [Tanacetum cinerariifolium]